MTVKEEIGKNYQKSKPTRGTSLPTGVDQHGISKRK